MNEEMKQTPWMIYASYMYNERWVLSVGLQYETKIETVTASLFSSVIEQHSILLVSTTDNPGAAVLFYLDCISAQ